MLGRNPLIPALVFLAQTDPKHNSDHTHSDNIAHYEVVVGNAATPISTNGKADISKANRNMPGVIEPRKRFTGDVWSLRYGDWGRRDII